MTYRLVKGGEFFRRLTDFGALTTDNPDEAGAYATEDEAQHLIDVASGRLDAFTIISWPPHPPEPDSKPEPEEPA